MHINLFVLKRCSYDLYSTDGGTVDKRTAGYARVGSVCTIDSVSVVEDHGGFQSINAATHELGHGYGNSHTTCSSFQASSHATFISPLSTSIKLL